MKKRQINRIFTAIAAAFIIVSAFSSYSLPVFAVQEDEIQPEASDNTASDSTASDSAISDSPVSDSTASDSAMSAITSITPLSDTEAEFSFEDKPALEELCAAFPKELSVFFDGAESSSPLSVTWECGDDYENTEYEIYDFTPVWDTDTYPLAPSFDTFADLPYITVYVQQAESSIGLLDAEKAKSSISSLAKDKDIYALLYLCDSYEVRQKPEKNAGTAVTISTGQSVRITGVDEDSMHNIWYQAAIEIGGSSYSGYIEREFLAYSDEDLLAWENQYISSQVYRMAAPAALGMDADSSAKMPADIAQFPSSYQSGLLNLKTAHPNWIFVKMNTDLDWNTAVQEENKASRSLISSKVSSSWKKSSFDSSWAYPTDGILAYYMDPRNFLTENHIFQFELLSYNGTYHTESAVQGILNGTFMSGAIPGDSKGQSYSQAFCTIAKQLDVSPFHLASRVRQEQGEGTSPLISGTHPTYPGVYNYFNIGATGQGSAQVIENGLKKAAEYQWTTRYLSLEGGSNIISKNYIRKGQNTLYLQKFNVSKTSPSGLYQHQYMQNIAAPSSEAVSVKKAYAAAGSINNPFVFRIPVYNNMPSSACPQPAEVKELTLSKTSLSLKAGETAALTASIDGKAAAASSVTFSSSNSKIASVAADGTVTAVSAGTAVISCTASGSSTASCNITVTKTAPAYTVPSLSAVTYAPEQTLADIKLPAGWKWDNPSIVPTVSNAGYPATFTPSDTGKYDTIKQTLPLKVNKGTPAYTIPSGLKTAAGNTLASIKLPAGFSWENPSTILEKEGTASCTASYNPDTANYQTVTGISIPVAVTKKPSTECSSHNYGEWTVTASPSCTADGEQSRSCLLCGAKENEKIPALGHSYSSVDTKPATEKENGIRTYTCSQCGNSYTEPIDKLPSSHKHSYTSKITANASCTAAGILTYSCSCGDSYTETIPATGHNYDSKITKEATETEEGIRTYTCSKCQDTYTEAIAKLPASHKHSYSSAITRQASCTEKGIKTYSCSCGDSYSEEISALGHDMADGKCRRCGYTEPTAAPSPKPADSSSSSGNGSNSNGGNGSGSSSTNESSNSGNSSANDSNHSSSSSANDSNHSGNSTAANNNNSSANSNNAANSSSTSAAVNSAGAASASQSTNGKASSSTGNKNTSSTTASSSTGNKNTSNTAAASSQQANAVTVDMRELTVLYEETLSAIRGKDIDVVLNMGNSISWTINGSNIIGDEANGIDMGIVPDSKNIPDTVMEYVSSLSEAQMVLSLSLNHDGPLEFYPMLTISTAPENARLIANLYYYNPEPGQLEFIEGTEIAENGDICFTFSHASDYVIIISETVMTDRAVISPESTDTDGETAQTSSADDIPGQETTDSDSPAGKKPSVILIIVIILLLIIAIAGTALLILHFKEKEAEEEEYEDEDEDDFEDDGDTEGDSPENRNGLKEKNSPKKEDALKRDNGLEEIEILEENINRTESRKTGRMNQKKDSSMEDFSLEEFSASDFPLDDGDSDDYHEPQKHKPIGNRPKFERNEFDDDEFDGFE